MAFENNVQGTLQANVAIGATTVDVVKAVAPNKDVPTSGRITLSKTGVSGSTSIIGVTATGSETYPHTFADIDVTGADTLDQTALVGTGATTALSFDNGGTWSAESIDHTAVSVPSSATAVKVRATTTDVTNAPTYRYYKIAVNKEFQIREFHLYDSAGASIFGAGTVATASSELGYSSTSSTTGGTYSPEYVYDGDTLTRYVTWNDTAGWLMFDVGTPTAIHTMSINIWDWGFTTFELFGSSDASTWVSLGNHGLSGVGNVVTNYTIPTTTVAASFTSATFDKIINTAAAATEIITYTARTNPTNSQTFAVTSVSTESGNKYYINGVRQQTLTLKVGSTYIFTYPSGHPFRFSTTADGTHGGGSEYTTGVTHNSATQTTVVVSDSTPAALYYYCSYHAGMGGSASVVSYWTLTGVAKNAESSFGDQAWSAGDSFFQALTAADVSNFTTIQSATAPTNPSIGTKWFNTTTGVLQEYLSDGTDSAWLDISAGAVLMAASTSATVIAPIAQGRISTEASGTAAGCSYSAYSSGNTTVTFNTAMADTNYSVITDKENFDAHQVIVSSKTTTSFVLQSKDTAGTGNMSPSSWPYAFVVYASDPVQNVIANKGDTGDTGGTGPAGAAGPASLSFGEFSIEPVTGMLSVNYYGAAYEEDFSINSNGELEVTT